ncbi:MAG: hypothetical protein AB7G28_23655 [Pirellulales bacterium]
MSNIDEVFEAAATFSPDDRVSLIARLWKSLPQESWPRATREELVAADRLLAKENLTRNESVPWPLVERILADSVRSSRPKVYSAPRRFDLSTIMVVTAGYAMLFGGINAIFNESDQAAGAALMIGVFVTLVGIGQALLFGGRRPRTASIVVGMILTTLFMISTTMFFSRGRSVAFLPFMLVYGVISGAIYGYLSGVLVGGVFLVADHLRRLFKRNSVEAEVGQPAAASPFDAS